MARAAPLMVPELVVDPFQLFIHRGCRKFVGLVQLRHDRGRRLAKLVVVEPNEVVKLLVKTDDLATRVTPRAHVLHLFAPLLPGKYLLNFARDAVAAFDLIAHFRQCGAIWPVIFAQIVENDHVELGRNRRPQRPADAFADIMRHALGARSAHMTARA